MSLASLEEEKQLYQEQLDIVAGQLRDDPDNVELSALQDELNNFIKLLNENIAELKPQQPAAPKQSPAKQQQPASPTPPPPPPSSEHTAAFKKSHDPVGEDDDEAPANYKVNDTVMAKWLSGDKAFYPARITSITGSSTAPIYTVKFKSYDNTETLRSRDIRPVSNKRKADGPSPAAAAPVPVVAAAAPASNAPGVVSSAGATIYPEAAKKDDASAGSDAPKPPKAKKIKAKKELEAGKNKWQEFNSKSKFGKSKKDSMFRTPEGVNGRVGFTGSGKSMRKDPTRSRHVYQMNDDQD
ncbi:survival of motor neuron-related-splicing factor 30 [Geosmithia morbida]|uniref:Survival of motor neuron-related-splicing factor 30 n=1 Tax=Geosmithia morbida TaxID=1094350 RepID=A0A9P4YVZ6_9HYPO|nr:survival of motor neuron-related-splicing factor 30 [Geosmithia morbida]KAF4122726.1 survival of motor neuron-related-splicing factor 30 [Geosmithia morbida]